MPKMSFFLPDLYVQMWQIQGMWGITEPPFWAVTWYESLPAAGKRLAWDFLPYGRTLTVVMYAAWSLKWERVDKVLTKSSLQSLQEKLDPVGSTVRYELMKLCTGSV